MRAYGLPFFFRIIWLLRYQVRNLLCLDSFTSITRLILNDDTNEARDNSHFTACSSEFLSPMSKLFWGNYPLIIKEDDSKANDLPINQLEKDQNVSL
jgi:hypothetical protein